MCSSYYFLFHFPGQEMLLLHCFNSLGFACLMRQTYPRIFSQMVVQNGDFSHGIPIQQKNYTKQKEIQVHRMTFQPCFVIKLAYPGGGMVKESNCSSKYWRENLLPFHPNPRNPLNPFPKKSSEKKNTSKCRWGGKLT